MAEKKKKRKTGWFGNIILLIALIVFAFSAYKLVTIMLEYKKGTDEYHALEVYSADATKEEQTVMEDEQGQFIMVNPIDFPSLRSINKDIVAWLTVEALDINYPVVQGTDNDHYLHYSFEGQPLFAGCIFMDYQNNKNFIDSNTVIYGHNMNNGSMFGSLKKFRNEETIATSPYFWIYTPTYMYKYEIFSCQVVGSTSKTYQISFKNKKDLKEYVDEAMNNSVIKTNATANENDTMVTLSTCTGDSSNRFIVQGKLIESYQVREQ